MEKLYLIKLDGEIIGKTKLEYGDPPMGVAFGKIITSDKIIDYQFIKSYCLKNKFKLADHYPEEKFISTNTIEQLKVISPEGIEVEGIGNQISGMDTEGFEITIMGISYPFYEKEFPYLVKEYRERFK